MSVSEVIEEHLPEVEEFLDGLERSTESTRGEEYRHIQALIRFAHRFYEEFLGPALGLGVTSFSFFDKRLVAEKIDQEENRESGSADGEQWNPQELDLGYRYLEICDQLHEDLLFGYSEDDADYVVFHEETFPDWLEEVGAWLKAEGKKGLAERVEELVARYRHAA